MGFTVCVHPGTTVSETKLFLVQQELIRAWVKTIAKHALQGTFVEKLQHMRQSVPKDGTALLAKEHAPYVQQATIVLRAHRSQLRVDQAATVRHNGTFAKPVQVAITARRQLMILFNAKLGLSVRLVAHKKCLVLLVIFVQKGPLFRKHVSEGPIV